MKWCGSVPQRQRNKGGNARNHTPCEQNSAACHRVPPPSTFEWTINKKSLKLHHGFSACRFYKGFIKVHQLHIAFVVLYSSSSSFVFSYG
jgi:hypothetical protein